MKRLNELLGALKALSAIQKPGRSFAEWERFLEDCRGAGLAAVWVDEDGQIGRFATPLGYALLRRWRWLRDARILGMGYDDAEVAFGVGLERDKTALIEAERHRAEALARATAEIDADEAFDHAKELGL